MVTSLLKIVIPFQVYEEFVAKKRHRFQFPKKEVIESKKCLEISSFRHLWVDKTIF